MRVKVNKTGLYAYPDVIAICGEAILEDEYVDTLLNPVVIAEVLSKSTEAYDRGAKFDHYRAIESLQEYVLVSQDTFLIKCYSRQSNDQWLLSIANKSADTITLSSVHCSLNLTKVYDKVDALNPIFKPGA
jgi:Uma2 family endonuclease